MYERFYGFEEKPFSLLPDPAFLYLGRQHSTAYSLLEYGVLNQAGFTVITGDIGCGKTTLIRHLLNQLDRDVTVGLLSNTHKGFSDLLRWVLMAFGLDYAPKGSVQLYDTFVEFLIAEYGRRRRVVLIVDEAQNLDVDALEELRTLSNINADKHLVLQLILVGQPELKATLERPELKQLAQRVVAHYHLTPLSQIDTIRYISHRIERVGGSAGLFTRDACLQVYRYSGGVPRLINLLCDTALTFGYAEEVSEIGKDLIQSVIDERAAGMNLGSDTDQPSLERQAVKSSIASVEDLKTEPTARKPETVIDFGRADARQLFSHLLE
jgi:general secretion pathway protein A